MRYQLVDRIVSFEADRCAVGIKNISRESDVFEHHFPSYPLYPGALMIESMAQTAGYLLGKSSLKLRNTLILTPLVSVERARFMKAVHPGDQLVISITKERVDGDLVHVQAGCEIVGEATARARLAFLCVPVPEEAHESFRAWAVRWFDALEPSQGFFS